MRILRVVSSAININHRQTKTVPSDAISCGPFPSLLIGYPGLRAKKYLFAEALAPDQIRNHEAGGVARILPAGIESPLRSGMYVQINPRFVYST